MAVDGNEGNAEKTNKDEVAVGEGNGETEKKINENVDDNQNNKVAVNDDKEIKLISNERLRDDDNKSDENIENEIAGDAKEKDLIRIERDDKSDDNDKKISNERAKAEESLPAASVRGIREDDDDSSPSAVGAKSGESSGLISNVTESEKNTLMDLRSKIEDAISSNEKNSGEEENLEADAVIEIDKDVSLWGVPLSPSKDDNRTNTILFKFLKARDFKVSDAFEMLKNTLRWRKENRMDSIINEDLGIELDYGSVSYTKGIDRDGHPICYNVYGVFANEEMYEKTFGNEASRDKFLRWRMQLLEKQIMELDFGPGGISTFLQVNDLKNAPGPSRRDLRLATRKAVDIFQDNYPEFVARNIFINVPFWYYAFNTLLSPFLTQRTKNKFVFSRPSRVTDTLVKYIGAEEIPVVYGGLRRETDPDFSILDAASETVLKAGATETVEIPAPEVGITLTWDLTITSWDVNYKEEFVPTDEGSYTLIVKKGRKISWQQEPIRNSFKNKEPGKVVITIENGMFRKKRVLYRYKADHQSVSSST